jgi:DNA mismatch repair ATPase MutL
MQPVFCLFLELPATLFDITLHPRKTEIHFDHWGIVSAVVHRRY